MKLLYIITLPIVFIRLLLTKIPIIQDVNYCFFHFLSIFKKIKIIINSSPILLKIVFWFFIPEISNDEKQDPIAYRRAMLEIGDFYFISFSEMLTIKIKN